jgi:hypothetical protein
VINWPSDNVQKGGGRKKVAVLGKWSSEDKKTVASPHRDAECAVYWQVPGIFLDLCHCNAVKIDDMNDEQPLLVPMTGQQPGAAQTWPLPGT